MRKLYVHVTIPKSTSSQRLSFPYSIYQEYNVIKSGTAIFYRSSLEAAFGRPTLCENTKNHLEVGVYTNRCPEKQLAVLVRESVFAGVRTTRVKPERKERKMKGVERTLKHQYPKS